MKIKVCYAPDKMDMSIVKYEVIDQLRNSDDYVVQQMYEWTTFHHGLKSFSYGELTILSPERIIKFEEEEIE